MIDILNHIAKERATFVPRDRREYVALQLARRLGDEAVVGRYVGLVHSYPEAVLLAAYRRLRVQIGDTLPALAFEAELKHGTFQGPGRLPPVLGIRIERRRIGLVLVNRGGIEHVQTLELSSNADTAVRSLEGLLRVVMPRIKEATVAIERVDEPRESRRKALTATAIGTLRNEAVSIWEVSRSDLRLALGNPPPRTPHAARQVASLFWPTLVGAAQQRVLLDAAMVALYVDVARQLSREESVTP